MFLVNIIGDCVMYTIFKKCKGLLNSFKGLYATGFAIFRISVSVTVNFNET